MQHLWSVISERAIRDTDSGEVSLITVINGIGMVLSEIPPSPFSLPFPIHITSAWWRSDVNQPEQGEMQLSYKSPEGAEITTVVRSVDLSEEAIVYVSGRFEGVPYVDDGWYKIEIKQRSSEQDEWTLVAELPLLVQLALEE